MLLENVARRSRQRGSPSRLKYIDRMSHLLLFFPIDRGASRSCIGRARRRDRIRGGGESRACSSERGADPILGSGHIFGVTPRRVDATRRRDMFHNM